MNLYEFSYNGPDGEADIDRTPDLGRALDEHLTEQYGEDRFVGGVLAFSSEKQLLGIQVMIDFADFDSEPNVPHGDGEQAWNTNIAFYRELGATHFLTFFRRPHGFGNAHPSEADEHMFTASGDLAPKYNMNYIGHLMTDGEFHGLLLEAPGRVDPMGLLMQALDDRLKASIGRQLLARLEELGDTPPEVLRAVEIGIERFETGEPPTPEQLAEIEAAKALLQQRIEADEGDNNSEMDGLLRSIEAHVQAPRPPKSPFDVPDINQRPDVPPAFYN